MADFPGGSRRVNAPPGHAQFDRDRQAELLPDIDAVHVHFRRDELVEFAAGVDALSEDAVLMAYPVQGDAQVMRGKGLELEKVVVVVGARIDGALEGFERAYTLGVVVHREVDEPALENLRSDKSSQKKKKRYRKQLHSPIQV